MHLLVLRSSSVYRGRGAALLFSIYGCPILLYIMTGGSLWGKCQIVLFSGCCTVWICSLAFDTQALKAQDAGRDFFVFVSTNGVGQENQLTRARGKAAVITRPASGRRSAPCSAVVAFFVFVCYRSCFVLHEDKETAAAVFVLCVVAKNVSFRWLLAEGF